jgi:hypothetical protein
LQALALNVLFDLLCSFGVRHLTTWRVLDLKDSVDFFQRQSGRLDVEEPDDWQPSQIEDGEDDVEAPSDRFNTFVEQSAIVDLPWRVLHLPTGVMETIM